MSQIDDFLNGKSSDQQPVDDIDSFLNEKPKRTWGEAIKDTGAQLAEGVNTTIGAIPNLVAPDSGGAGFFRDNAEYWREAQSEPLKQRITASDEKIRKAGEDGLGSQIGTAASEYWNDPAQAARLVTTNLPSMIPGLGAGKLAQGAAIAKGASLAKQASIATGTAAAVNAAMNAGGARGEAFDDLQRSHIAQGATPEAAREAALSESLLPAAVGGVAGAVSGKFGLEKSLLGQAGTGSAVRGALRSAGAEIAGEQVEEVAPKIATNMQVGRIDSERGALDDVGRTMVETTIGAGPGAIAAGGFEAARTPGKPASIAPTAQSAGAQAFAAGQPMTPPADIKSVVEKAQFVRDWQDAAAASMTTAPGAAGQGEAVTPSGDVLPEVPGGMAGVQRTFNPRAGGKPPISMLQTDAGGNAIDFEASPEFDSSPREFQPLKENEPTRMLGFNPLAGTPRVYPDGTVALGSDQDEFTKFIPSRATQIKRSEQMGLNPAAGPMSAAAATAVDSGAYDQAQQQSAMAQAAEVAAQEAKKPAKKYAHRVNGTLDGKPFQTMVMAATPDEAMVAAVKASPGLQPASAEPVSKSATPSATPGEPANGTTPAQAVTKEPGRQTEKQDALSSGVVLHPSGAEVVGAKSLGNSSSADSKRLSDLAGSEALLKKWLDGIDAEADASVKRHMLRVSQDPKIFNSVVELIPVDVMNMLGRLKLTPEMIFNNPSVLKGNGVRGNGDNSVAIPVDAAASIMRAVAIGTAKNLAVDKPSHSGGLPVSGGSANDAVKPGSIDVVWGLPGHGGGLVRRAAGPAAKNVGSPDDLGLVPSDKSAALDAWNSKHGGNPVAGLNGNVSESVEATPQGREAQPAPADLKPPRGILAKKAEADAARAASTTNVQDAPQQPAGTEAQATTGEARAPEGGNATASEGVPAAPGAGDVQADGVKRSKNGYAEVRLNGKKHVVTPYDDYFVIRDADGLLVRDEENKTLKFKSEPDAIQHAERNAKPKTESDAIAEAAHQAATSHKNDLPQPTDAQKEAGNYVKGHVTINGHGISIENPAGSKRRPEWPALKNHYGYFKGSVGADKDHVDLFMTDRAGDASLPVFVVDQTNRDGTFDEHKIIMGAADEAEARATYLQNYEKGWTGLGAITQMSQDEFKAWVRDPAKTKKPVALKRGVLAKMAEQKAKAARRKSEDIRDSRWESMNLSERERVAEAIGRKGIFAQKLAEKRWDRIDAEVKTKLREVLDVQQPAKPQQETETTAELSKDAGSVSQAETEKDDDGINVTAGKGSIKDKYFVEVDGDRAPGGPWDTPEQARLAGEEWKKKTIQNAKDTKQERERWNAIAENFKAGKEVTTAQIESLGLKAGTSDVRWLFPISARLFDITSRDIRPLVKDLIRDSFTDMGAKREFVPTRKALEAIAADVVAGEQKAESAVKPSEMYRRLQQLSARANRKPYTPLTEEEFKVVVDAGLATGKKWSTGKLNTEGYGRLAQLEADETESSNARADAEDLIAEGLPFKASAVDQYGLVVPDGYVRQGGMFEKSTAKAPPAEPVKPDPAQQPKAEKPAEDDVKPAQKTAEKIEDFGEKLAGARKDYAATLKDAMSVDVAAEPLSKSWPEPDYQKLLDGGADPFIVSWVHAARDEIPTKPQTSWKLSGWVKSVDMLRKVSSQMLSGEVTKERLQEMLEKPEYSNLKRQLGGRAELYQAVGHGKSLKGITFMEHHYSMYRDEKNVTKWSVEMKAKSSSFGGWPREIAVADTKADALAQFKAKYEGLDAGAKGKGAASFVIYRKRGEPGAFIGKKIGREYIDLHKAEDVKAARAYLADNTDKLEKALERYKDTPYERGEENAPRVGDDHRNGAPVTPEVFGQTFGFRGVQFGNYVEQGRRQSDLNEAFDALMDMAAVLGIPPKAISLNGRLGLAFGARGKGGKNAPAAHYEAGNVVINLTKGGGPGSLAHEWFHAMDNYFAKQGGGAGYMTDGADGAALREEMRQAFKAVKTAVNTGALKLRSLELDKRRTKPYWSTPIEMAARSFESYVVAKLQDQNASNDYLANVVNDKVWEISEAARAEFFTGKQASPSYPYPTVDELPVLRAAFDDFFKVVQTRETEDGNTEMFYGTKDQAQGTPTDRAVMAMASEGKSADDILRFIANASKSPFNRQIAHLLRRTGANPAVSLGGDMGGGAGFKFLAKYSRKNHEVTLSEGASGKAEQIFLHETVHAATLLALDRGGEHAARMKALYESVKSQGFSDAYGMKNVGEFVAEAFTNKEFQQALKGYKAPGGTAWDRFVAAVRRILGMSDRSQDALSAALELGVEVMRENVPLRKARSFSAEDAPEYFGMADAASLKQSALDQIHQTLSHPGKVSVWDKTIGTMRNLSERSPAFKPVFDAAQRFLDDVSLLANEAADVAPRLLPRVESWRDLTKKPVSAEDNKAISKPIFEGTLLWMRDETTGEVVKVDDLKDRLEKENAARRERNAKILDGHDETAWTTARKKQELIKRGFLSDKVLKMWEGQREGWQEAAIEGKFKRDILDLDDRGDTPTDALKAGVVFTSAELKSLFNLNDQQISLYQEARKAIDRSIDLTARADMLRSAGTGYAAMRDVVFEAPTMAEARDLLVQTMHDDALGDETQADRLSSIIHTVNARYESAEKLMKDGYAPLSRFGRYTLDVVDTSGERQYFGMYESMRDANLAKIQMAGAFPGATITQGTMSAEAYKLFAGITPESLELFGNMLGLDAEGGDARDKAFQEYLKLSKNNHSALKRLMHRKGIAGYSEDVGRVLASFVYSNARQAAGGLNAGTIEEAVNAIPKDQGELKDVAMGLRDYVRDPQEEGQAIRGMLFAQYLGGSLASAFVNTTQPFAVTLPWLSRFGGMKVAGKHLAKALKDMAGKGAYEADLKTALDRAEEDGVVSPQEIHQLMAQARGAGGLRSGDGTRAGNARAAASNAWERTKVAWGQPFALAEQFNRRSTFIAAYRLAKERGMQSPAEFARRAVLETQFLYSKANKPRWARGAVGGTLFTFKTYSVSYLELLNRMWTQGGPEGKRAVGWAMVMLMLMGGAGGLPFLEDLEDLIDGIAQMMGYNLSAKRWRQEAIAQIVGKELGEFVNSGLSGLPGAPIDVSGRLGMGDLIPGTGLFLTKQNRERDLMEIVGPAGDLVSRGFKGARKALTGDIGGAALELSPTAVRNAAKGIDMAASGMYKDTKGYKVMDTTLAEAAAKLVGLQPRSVAKDSEATGFKMRTKSYYIQQSSEIKAQWADALFRKDEGALQDVRDRLADWNRKNPDLPIVVKMPDVWKRVREMGKDRTQRIADTAPKALRQEMRELARDN